MSSSSCVISGTSLSSRGLLRMEDEAKASEKQGIVSILGSEPNNSKTPSSLRRTLSADMSSKKWLGRHGFTPLKKIPSSESFPVHSSSSSSSSSSTSSLSDGEDEEQVVGRTRKKPEFEGKFDNWNLLVPTEKQQKEEDLKRPGLSDIWGSILSQKVEDSSISSSALYIPPPVKRSKSSLSQKSLEICTESLGSETGSDGFSSRSTPSEASDLEDKSAEEEQSNKETEQVEEEEEEEVDPVADEKREDLEAANYNSSVIRKSPPRSFPPPLPSLARREGPGVLMRSHRSDGRLVVEAVPVSSYNYFHSERQSGRLLLSFIKNPSAELMKNDEEEEDEEEKEVEEEMELDDEVEKEVEADVFEFQGFDEEEETERMEKTEEVGVQNRGLVTEEVKGSQPKTVMVPCEVVSVHKSATSLTRKRMGLSNKNRTWSFSHKKNIEAEEEEEAEEEIEEEEGETEEIEEPTQLPQSLPCPPRVARLIASPAASAATAASFNAYDYSWRAKPSAATIYSTQESHPSPPPPSPIVDNNNFCFYPNKLYNNKNKIDNNNKSVTMKGDVNPQENQKQKMVLRGNNEADCLVPPVRGCKEARRSLPMWHPPRCIATS